jgi:hypothetical protein
MMSVVEAFISTNPEEVQAHYAKMKPLWTRLQVEWEEDMKARQEQSDAEWDADLKKRKADMLKA